MPGMEFEYDEQGGTFYYFLLSFLALVLIPVTFYLWPSEKRNEEDKEKQKKDCRCYPCRSKSTRLQSSKPWKRTKNNIIKVCILCGWVFLVYVAYKASQVELDLTDFDPYAELEIDRGATEKEVKKAYRKLSLIYHPDRETGDSRKFMKITKALKALTDEEARKNWEEYGNPDGPGATHFGIALPKWIVEKQNSMWVLAVYGLVFMVILPVAVGSWWYRSIKYSAEQILMDTMQLYRFFVHKTPNMILKRVIMILGASFEFAKTHNSEIVIRPSDNEEVPMLMKEVPHMMEKSKEPPLGFPYSVKARTLLHAHFSRIDLNPKTLEIDKNYMLKKCPYLINEMINIAAMLVAMGHAGRVAKMPRLDTIESMMRLSQMIIQAVWDNKSSLLQLPHIREDMLRHFVTRKRNVRTIQQFVQMKDEDRRSIVRLPDEEYRDIINVCSYMPHVSMDISITVLDDEDSNIITAGSIVTVHVQLKREKLSVLFDEGTTPFTEDIDNGMELQDEDGMDGATGDYVENEDENGEETKEGKEEEKKQPQTKVWEKQKKKKGKGGKKGKKPPVKQQHFVKKVVQTVTPAATTEDKLQDNPSSESPKSTPSHKSKSKKETKSKDADDVSTDDYSENEDENNDDNLSEEEKDTTKVDDDDWQDYEDAKKENSLETKSKETHLVHCPYFPIKKYEWWWLYAADRKNHSLITAPVQICSLKDSEEVQLKFSAPPKPGKYKYSVILRSDSYFMDFDQIKNFEMEVKEAKKIESHPQWEEVPSDEDEDKDASESDVTTDTESDED